MRDGFIVHEKTMAQVAMLTNEQAGELLKAMVAHYNGEEQGDVSQIVGVLMVDITERMDSDKASYEKVSRKRSDSGKSGAGKRWQSNSTNMANDDKTIAKDSKDIANDGKDMAKDSKGMTKDGVSDSVSESVIKESSSSKSKRKAFVPPTAEEVGAYCLERQNGIDPEEFIAFYEARDWMSGKTKIANWKSCVITWEKKRKNDNRNRHPVQPRSSPAGKFVNFPQRDDAEQRDLVRQIVAMR